MRGGHFKEDHIPSSLTLALLFETHRFVSVTRAEKYFNETTRFFFERRDAHTVRVVFEISNHSRGIGTCDKFLNLDRCYLVTLNEFTKQ